TTLPLCHPTGGEFTGTIDESIPHAVTKSAHIHFPASRDAHDRIVKLGEQPEHVHLVGCPRIDLIAQVIKDDENGLSSAIFGEGVGPSFSLDEAFLLISQHPVTTEYGSGEAQINATLEAADAVGL